MSTDVSKLHKLRGSADFEAMKSQEGRSGSTCKQEECLARILDTLRTSCLVRRLKYKERGGWLDQGLSFGMQNGSTGLLTCLLTTNDKTPTNTALSQVRETFS